MTPQPPQKLALSVPEAARVIGIGKSKMWELIARREVEAIKLAGRTLVRPEALASFVASAEPARPSGRA